MLTKEQVKKEVDKIPDSLLEEAYALLKKITSRKKDFNWKAWENNLEKFTTDFMNARSQALDSPRDSF